MKQVLLSFLFLLVSVATVLGQSTVTLNINHTYGGNAFDRTTVGQNNMGHEFSLERLEYYVSDIVFIHDGGQETAAEGVFLLVDGLDPMAFSLGEYSIDVLEAIRFGIGVNADYNHLDPTTYDAEHPLAPRFPSMHWGWASGYRFVALEGFPASNPNVAIQLHALGDDNFRMQTIEVAANTANGELMINLDADYESALRNINVSSALIVHGDFGAARSMLTNFSTEVFTASAVTTHTNDILNVVDFTLAPNPVVDGRTEVNFNTTIDGPFFYQVVDARGAIVAKGNLATGQTSLNLSNEAAGLYFVQLLQSGKVVMNRTLSVVR